MDEDIGDDSHEYAVGDAVGQWHEDDADEAWNAGDIIGEVNLADFVHHHDAYEYQRCCRSL